MKIIIEVKESAKLSRIESLGKNPETLQYQYPDVIRSVDKNFIKNDKE